LRTTTDQRNMFTTIRGLLLTVPWVLYLLLADIVLSALLPLSFFFENWVYDASSFLAFTVWEAVQIIFEVCNGAKITSSGTTLPVGESAIVVANHVSWTDFYMIQALARRAGMLSRCRWFAKVELRWVPFLGWGLWAMRMPLVSRKWTHDKLEMDRVFAGIVDNNWPTWLISYSEATRYTPKKYEETKIWCKAIDRPLPIHLLYPRTKGFISTVQHLRKAKHMKAVYDVTIAYSHKNKFLEAPTIWETLSMSDISGYGGYKFHVDVQRFDLEDLPLTDPELAKWLENRWIIKGEWLDKKRAEWQASNKA